LIMTIRLATKTPGDNALPPPDAAGREHSERLTAHITQRIEAGALSFAEYMQLALYFPGLGYYMAGAQKFGAGGDFITAPEVSPLFGQALAVQSREVLDELAAGEQECIVEFGAGSGALAVSLFGALLDRPHLRYRIVETSPELALRQRDALRAALGEAAVERVDWLDALPTGVQGVIVANEVVDALAVERFVKRSDKAGDIWRVGVTLAEASDRDTPFKDQAMQATPELVARVTAVEAELESPLPPGYASEIGMQVAPWVAAVGASLARGVVLIADYGYPRRERYSEERGRGTLACYYRHRAHDDAYRWPGLQDITAHVDFTAIAEAAAPSGLEFLGYASQGAFLLGNDLTGLAETAAASLERELDRIVLASAVKTLTLPGEMGERFQVMALGKGYDRALRGFSLQDLAYRL
jgi:SAM-dependent MidA family methyltransferase